MFLEPPHAAPSGDPVTIFPGGYNQANPLIERMNKFVALGASETGAVRQLTRIRRSLRMNETLVREDRKPDRIYLILKGVAFRYRYLIDGRRQIFGYLFPGDLCDTQFVILNECDHNVGLLCDSEVALISLPDLMGAMVTFPKIERALLMMAVVDSAILRENLLNLGQRDAFEKIGHFFCEITARMRAIGQINADGSFSLPLTQMELADTLGLTVVHVNRILQRFRLEGVLCWSRRQVIILNQPKLESIAAFNGAYLHLDAPREEPALQAWG